jgi:hypothetical protein
LVPLVVNAWPRPIAPAELGSQPGSYELAVVQDGRYRTTCRFTVKDGRVDGDGRVSRRLPCEPSTSPASLAANELAQSLRGFGPIAERRKEVHALATSKEVREARIPHDQVRRYADAFTAQAEGAELDEQRAVTRRDAKAAHAKAAYSRREARGTEDAIPAAESIYRRLVERYGKE